MTANNNLTIGLKKQALSLTIGLPDLNQGYYRGTRFDWAGLIRDIRIGRHRYVDEWFDSYDPLRHDCVCGPAEEFTEIGYDQAHAGGEFLKIGVGTLVKPREKEYDRFKLYNIANPGKRTFFKQDDDEVSFRHLLIADDYGYDYRKKIFLADEDRIILKHTLKNLGPSELPGSVYDHNFFTLGKSIVGTDTRISFPFKPIGDWRNANDSVCLTENGIAFSRPLQQEEVVYMGNLHPFEQNEQETYGGYAFELGNAKTGMNVKAQCTSAFTHFVFWANHRIACLEPYIPFHIYPGESFNWEIEYLFI
jgi:hypothetical protein